MARNARVFEADLTKLLPSLSARAGLSKAAETRIAKTTREELRKVLTRVVEDAFTDSNGFGIRSKNAYNVMRRGGVKAYGTTFNALRGHIIGPTYIIKQEEGGTILPVRAKAIAVPLPAALRPDGTPKLPGPRSWQNILPTFVYKSKGTGRAYIAYNNGGGLTLLYALVRKVDIPAKGALARAWDRNKVDVIQAFGNAMLLEFSRVDLMSLARITTKGKGARRG